MQLQDYIKRKKQSLVETNKDLSDDKLRVQGAWTVLQEIEEFVKTTPPEIPAPLHRGELREETAPKSPKGDFEEEKNHPVSEYTAPPSTEGNNKKTKGAK